MLELLKILYHVEYKERRLSHSTGMKQVKNRVFVYIEQCFFAFNWLIRNLFQVAQLTLTKALFKL
jgi:hypothetical protein